METPKPTDFEFRAGGAGLLGQVHARIKPKLSGLSELSAWRAAEAICFDWAVIAGAVCVSEVCASVPVTAAMLVVIAARQHALFILMHESAHFRLAKTRWWNDFLGDYVITYPLFIKMAAYRENHREHHRYTNTAKDPDWVRKQTGEWRFPKRRAVLARMFLRYAWGFGLKEMGLTIRALSRAPGLGKADYFWRVGYYGILAGALTYFGLWKGFAIYWLVPYFFMLPVFMRIRSIAEHFALPLEHELNGTRNVLCSRFERFFVVPHHAALHADHHLYPSVPFYRLPELHRELNEIAAYRANIYQNTSYLGSSRSSVVSDLLHGPVKESSQPAKLAV